MCGPNRVFYLVCFVLESLSLILWRDPQAPDAVGPDGSRWPREGRAVKPGREPAGTGRSRGWKNNTNSTINR